MILASPRNFALCSGAEARPRLVSGSVFKTDGAPRKRAPGGFDSRALPLDALFKGILTTCSRPAQTGSNRMAVAKAWQNGAAPAGGGERCWCACLTRPRQSEPWPPSGVGLKHVCGSADTWQVLATSTS